MRQHHKCITTHTMTYHNYHEVIKFIATRYKGVWCGCGLWSKQQVVRCYLLIRCQAINPLLSWHDYMAMVWWVNQCSQTSFIGAELKQNGSHDMPDWSCYVLHSGIDELIYCTCIISDCQATTCTSNVSTNLQVQTAPGIPGMPVCRGSAWKLRKSGSLLLWLAEKQDEVGTCQWSPDAPQPDSSSPVHNGSSVHTSKVCTSTKSTESTHFLVRTIYPPKQITTFISGNCVIVGACFQSEGYVGWLYRGIAAM